MDIEMERERVEFCVCKCGFFLAFFCPFILLFPSSIYCFSKRPSPLPAASVDVGFIGPAFCILVWHNLNGFLYAFAFQSPSNKMGEKHKSLCMSVNKKRQNAN
jgi:hypothetical protein